MKRMMSLSGMIAALCVATTLALGQPPAAPNPQNQPGAGPGGRGGPGGFDPARAAQFMMRMGGFQPPVVVTTEKYLIIVRGNTVFQLDINTLEILHKQELPMPEGFVLPPQQPGGMQPPPPPPGG